MKDIKPVTGLFAVYDPTTEYIVHTTIASAPEESIELWMDIEGGLNNLANLCRQTRGEKQRCFQSWEQFEAEGYKVIRVSVAAESPEPVQPELDSSNL